MAGHNTPKQPYMAQAVLTRWDLKTHVGKQIGSRLLVTKTWHPIGIQDSHVGTRGWYGMYRFF